MEEDEPLYTDAEGNEWKKSVPSGCHFILEQHVVEIQRIVARLKINLHD